MEKAITTEELPEITYSISQWTTISGAQEPRVILDPESLTVYVWNTVGAGTPEPVWHNRHRMLCVVPLSTVPEALEDALRSHESAIRAIAESYLGTEWNGHNHVGRWADKEEGYDYDLALDDLSSYWDADEYFAPAAADVIRGVLAAAREGHTLEQIVEGEEEAAASEGHVLAGTEEALRWLLERRLGELDPEEEDEHSLITKLLG